MIPRLGRSGGLEGETNHTRLMCFFGFMFVFFYFFGVEEVPQDRKAYIIRSDPMRSKPHVACLTL